MPEKTLTQNANSAAEDKKTSKKSKTEIKHTRWSKFWHWVTYDRRSWRRLAKEISSYKPRLETRIEREKSKDTWAVTCEKYLESAIEALDRYDVDEGWSCFLEAQRQEIDGFNSDELAALRVSLQKEIMEKLKDWRLAAASYILSEEFRGGGDTKKAIEKLLREVMKSSGADIAKATDFISSAQKKIIRPERQDAALIKEVLILRNEHFYNQYFKIKFLRTQLSIVGVIVFLILLIIGWISMAPYKILPGDVRYMILLAAVFGAFGGTLSAAYSLTRSKGRRKIPELLQSWNITLIRPVIGAAAAVAAYFFLKAGVLEFVLQINEWVIVVLSFLAGFSEQWFLRLVESAGEKAK